MNSEPEHTATGERSVAELFRELASETGTLVRHEVELAALEMTHKATSAGRQLAFVAAGSLLAVVSLLTLLLALVLGLGTMLALWLAALLVGLVVAVIAFGVTAKGVAGLRSMDLKPKQTIQTIQDNQAWLQGQVR
jgi:hypothetical protein